VLTATVCVARWPIIERRLLLAVRCHAGRELRPAGTRLQPLCRFRKLYPFASAVDDESEHDRRIIAIGFGPSACRAIAFGMRSHR
jgi:hypothetical protein